MAFTVKVVQDGNDLFIPLPDEVRRELGATIGTVFSCKALADQNAIQLTMLDDKAVYESE